MNGLAEQMVKPWRRSAYPLRLAAYGVVVFVAYQAIFASVERADAAQIASENGPLEMTQVVLTCLSSVALFAAAFWTRHGRLVLCLTAAVVAYAAAREADLLLETLFFDDAYKYLVGIPMVMLSLTMLVLHGKQGIREAWSLMREPPVTLFMVGGIFLCTVCQMLDRPGLWIAAGVPDELRTIRMLVEESSELFAYSLIAFAGIESLILAAASRADGCDVQHDNALDADPQELRIPASSLAETDPRSLAA